jgi:HTH-type transcriptional regulator/antitoxin HigA
MTPTDITPAEVFPPGEFIREELDARGWSQADLAAILGRPPRLISELVAGKRAVSPETAKGLAQAFGTSAELWMNLESGYRLSKVRGTSNDVGRRARLYDKVPVKDLVRRGWIRHSANVEVLEQQVLEFLAVKSIDEAPSIRAAARKSMVAEPWTGAEVAWLMRVRQLAQSVKVAHPVGKSLDRLLVKLRPLLKSDSSVREVCGMLREAGIRLVVVEPLPQSKIDGACLWLGPREPVIALSFRYDRIDWFWFTLMHELGHVARGDGRTEGARLDVELVGETSSSRTERPEEELAADRFAADFLAHPKALDEFVVKLRGRCSHGDITEIAARLETHPGIVVGQLQHRTVIPFSHFRRWLVKVRETVVRATPTDGWGVHSVKRRELEGRAGSPPK